MIFFKKNYKLQEKKLGAIWPFFLMQLGWKTALRVFETKF